MDVLIHNDQPLERWREGVMTRMRMSALLGGRQLCIFDQFCDPGLGAPIHSHAVEEVLEVIEGTAEIWLVRATLAAPIFEASYGDRAETSRRWTPDHFDL
jgi:quercetin dioxygenase-like cupin family protein